MLMVSNKFLFLVQDISFFLLYILLCPGIKMKFHFSLRMRVAKSEFLFFLIPKNTFTMLNQHFVPILYNNIQLIRLFL